MHSHTRTHGGDTWSLLVSHGRLCNGWWHCWSPGSVASGGSSVIESWTLFEMLNLSYASFILGLFELQVCYPSCLYSIRWSIVSITQCPFSVPVWDLDSHRRGKNYQRSSGSSLFGRTLPTRLALLRPPTLILIHLRVVYSLTAAS